jgi:prophage regulatory protein
MVIYTVSTSGPEIVMAHDTLLLPMKAVARLTTLSRSTIYRRIGEGTFPKSIKLGGRRVAFLNSEIERWAANPGGYHMHPSG